jgi:hypothetical protein
VVASPRCIVDTIVERTRPAAGQSPVQSSDTSLLLVPHPSEREFVTVGRKNGTVMLWTLTSGTKITETTIFGRSGVGTCTVRAYPTRPCLHNRPPALLSRRCVVRLIIIGDG